MPPQAFASFLRIAAIAFVLGLILVEQRTFGEIARGGSPEGDGASRNVRDVLVDALARGGIRGLAVSTLAAFAWGAASWSRLGWDVLVGAEILLALAVLEVGIAAAAIRLALGLVGRAGPESTPRALLFLRLGVLATGALYGIVIWRRSSGGPGETLFAIFALGAALGVLGLNRTAQMPSERLVRLALVLRRR